MNKCPFCGTSETIELRYSETILFKCGSSLYPTGQGWPCRQIAALQEKVECLKDLHLEISALQERLEAWRATKVGWDEYWEELNEPEQQRLKALNEL